MKIRKLTPLIYLELFLGCLIPTFFCIPQLVYLLFLRETDSLVRFICIASIVAMTNLWIVVLSGKEIKRHKKFTKFATVTGSTALLIQILHFLIFDFKIQIVISFFMKLADISKSQEVFQNSGVLFFVGMIGSFIVGAKYLILLTEEEKN